MSCLCYYIELAIVLNSTNVIFWSPSWKIYTLDNIKGYKNNNLIIFFISLPVTYGRIIYQCQHSHCHMFGIFSWLVPDRYHRHSRSNIRWRHCPHKSVRVCETFRNSSQVMTPSLLRSILLKASSILSSSSGLTEACLQQQKSPWPGWKWNISNEILPLPSPNNTKGEVPSILMDIKKTRPLFSSSWTLLWKMFAKPLPIF